MGILCELPRVEAKTAEDFPASFKDDFTFSIRVRTFLAAASAVTEPPPSLSPLSILFSSLSCLIYTARTFRKEIYSASFYFSSFQPLNLLKGGILPN